MPPMTDRERFLRCILGQDVDRLPFYLMEGPWERTWRRWQREGKPADIQDHRGFAQPDAYPRIVPVAYGPCPPAEPRVISRDEHSIVHVDLFGIVRRDLLDNESMSQFLEFPVHGWDDWRAYKAHHLDPDHPDRLASDWLAQCRQWMQRGWPIQLGAYPTCSVFGGLRWLLGDEEGLLAFYDMPDLVHEIMNHLTTVMLRVFEKVTAAGVRVDVIHIWEDMCGRQGPLISPAHWREFMGPCYRRIQQFAQEHAIPVISVDTDGWFDPIMPPMMECGVNFIYPLEVAAGCDVNGLRGRYPRLGLLGGIDKRVLAKGPEAIDAELDRIWPATRTGRYIPELDHLIPDDVSWQNFLHYVGSLKHRIFGDRRPGS